MSYSAVLNEMGVEITEDPAGESRKDKPQNKRHPALGALPCAGVKTVGFCANKDRRARNCSISVARERRHTTVFRKTILRWLEALKGSSYGILREARLHCSLDRMRRLS